jgi:hypothetical protein
MGTETPPPANYVASKAIRISLNVILPSGNPRDIKYLVEYLDDDGFHRPLPKIGDPHPCNGKPIAEENGTLDAPPFAHIKWHHHSDCITIDIGGALYQICWP